MSKLWGGRFSKKSHKLLEEFSCSIHFDHKLAPYDCVGSLLHIKVLKKAKLITAAEYSKLNKALKEIQASIKSGRFKYDESFEDIHAYIQHLVEKKAGQAGLKLHTCRSRNDQVAIATKLYCLQNLYDVFNLAADLDHSLYKLAQKHEKTYIPGYTHLQHAIPVSLGLHLDAYCNMLSRDMKRLNQVAQNIEYTMGAGALAGTIIPAAHYKQNTPGVKPKTALEIGPTDNPMDSVSDRDFIIEALSALSIMSMHLSRLSEDMILWASQEFNFIDIDDAFCTGSSLMPQKKNPDVFELIRGSTGKIYGNLMSVLTTMKGLPMTYNRDMQWDKEPLFESFEIISRELIILTELFKNVKINKDNINKQLDDESLYATDLADFLVQNKVPFKESHAIIGKLIQYKYQKGIAIKNMTDKQLAKIHPALTTKAVKKILNPDTSVVSKKSIKK